MTDWSFSTNSFYVKCSQQNEAKRTDYLEPYNKPNTGGKNKEIVTLT